MRLEASDIPVGKYKAQNAFVDLGRYIFTVHYAGFLRVREATIPYAQVTGLEFSWPRRRLTVRWRDGKHRRKICTCFPKEEKLVLYYLYHILRAAVPERAACRMRPGPLKRARMEALQGKYGLNHWFEKHNPYRDQAALALARDADLPIKTAARITDRVFNTYQDVLYKNMPYAALWDLKKTGKTAPNPPKVPEEAWQCTEQNAVGCCPRCGSKKIMSWPRHHLHNVDQWKHFPLLSLAVSLLNSRHLNFMCKACGYIWISKK